jgi:peptidoglycan hydrolase FlgJ
MLPLAPFAVSALTTAGKALAGGAASALSDATAPAKATDGVKSAHGHGHGTDKAKKTADDFETMFLEQSMDRLTASEGTDGPLGENGVGGGVYRSMLSQQYAQQIAKSGGVGVSDQVYGAILKMQEAGNAR